MTSDGSRLPSVAHVPMAQAGRGSTLIRVAERLGAAHVEAGGEAVLVLSREVAGSVTGVPVRAVDYGRRWFSREEVVTDWVDGGLGRVRRNYGGVFDAPARYLAAQPRDVVLLYDGHYTAASLPRWAGVRAQGSQVCLYVHNPLSRSYGSRELRRLLGRADRVIFCAEHLRAATAKRVGRRRARGFEVVHNGVDDVFRVPGPREVPDGEFVVLFAGRVAENQGVHLVIEAVDLVRERVARPVRVRVVGGSRYGAGGLDAYEVWLRETAAGVGVPVDFLPFSDRHAVAAEMRAASVVCLPSTWAEGFPLVVLEAMASGTPVVTSDSPGMLEAAGGVALVAPMGDVASLVDGICDLASDPGLWRERSEAGRARASEFTWDAAARAVAGLPPA